MEEYGKYFVCYRNILTDELDENGNKLALVTEIIGSNPRKTFDEVMLYIKENPECNIYAWGQTGIAESDDNCSTDVISTYAIEEIKRERLEQINKHGFDINDDLYYHNNELLTAALYCIGDARSFWPSNWDVKFEEKIKAKTFIDRLVVAAALIAAEIDRLKTIGNIERENIIDIPSELEPYPLSTDEVFINDIRQARDDREAGSSADFNALTADILDNEMSIELEKVNSLPKGEVESYHMDYIDLSGKDLVDQDGFPIILNTDFTEIDEYGTHLVKEEDELNEV